MNKKFICTAVVALLFSTFVAAQNESLVTAEKTREKVEFRTKNPSQDQTNQLEITGLGGSTFTAMNVSDGTANSYDHTLTVTIDLIPANKTAATNFQLYFYSTPGKIPHAAFYNNAALNIYYPISLYESIKERLELALAAKKK